MSEPLPDDSGDGDEFDDELRDAVPIDGDVGAVRATRSLDTGVAMAAAAAAARAPGTARTNPADRTEVLPEDEGDSEWEDEDEDRTARVEIKLERGPDSPPFGEVPPDLRGFDRSLAAQEASERRRRVMRDGLARQRTKMEEEELPPEMRFEDVQLAAQRWATERRADLARLFAARGAAAEAELQAEVARMADLKVSESGAGTPVRRTPSRQRGDPRAGAGAAGAAAAAGSAAASAATPTRRLLFHERAVQEAVQEEEEEEEEDADDSYRGRESDDGYVDEDAEHEETYSEEERREAAEAGGAGGAAAAAAEDAERRAEASRAVANAAMVAHAMAAGTISDEAAVAALARPPRPVVRASIDVTDEFLLHLQGGQTTATSAAALLNQVRMGLYKMRADDQVTLKYQWGLYPTDTQLVLECGAFSNAIRLVGSAFPRMRLLRIFFIHGVTGQVDPDQRRVMDGTRVVGFVVSREFYVGFVSSVIGLFGRIANLRVSVVTNSGLFAETLRSQQVWQTERQREAVAPRIDVVEQPELTWESAWSMA